MEPHTLNRNFIKQQIIDGFDSIIWTERYYGDSEVELVVPATPEMFTKLPLGTFLGLDKSDEIMILESFTIDKGKYKLTGISLLPWLDNRFVRTSAKHDDEHWYLDCESVGWGLWAIVYYMCVTGSPYLNGTTPTGIPNPQTLAIPGLGLRDYDKSGSPVKLAVPYGPVYKALREIATTYKYGMQITLDAVSDTSYSLGFRDYKGIDRTSAQSDNPVVRFSPQMDSFTDIKDLQSIAALKTIVYTFVPGLKPEEGQPDLRTSPGISALSGPQYTGFDLRALQEFEGDISTDQVGGNQQTLIDILNSRALDKLTNNQFVKSVDGEIVPDSQFQYGVHYNLGDVIEVEGNTGVVQTARITEYIRSQDQAGEKAYPTVSMTD
jgi:Siphovirus ReqiPepy6 Gp37-like protein